MHVADSTAGWLGINSHTKNKCIINGTFMLGFNGLLSLYLKNNLAKNVSSVTSYSHVPICETMIPCSDSVEQRVANDLHRNGKKKIWK